MKFLYIFFVLILLSCNNQTKKKTAKPKVKIQPKNMIGGYGQGFNGLQLKIEAAEKYKIGEQIIVEFTFKNISTQSIIVSDFSDVYHSIFQTFKFMDTTGEKIGHEDAMILFKEKFDIKDELQPGKLLNKKITLNHWLLKDSKNAFEKIGTKARTIVVTGKYFTPKEYIFGDNKRWIGSIESKPIKINIIK